MGKPVFLKVIFLRLLGFDLRRYDTCQFGLLNRKKKSDSQHGRGILSINVSFRRSQSYFLQGFIIF